MESLGWIGVSCPTFDSEQEDDGIRVPTYLGGRRIVCGRPCTDRRQTPLAGAAPRVVSGSAGSRSQWTS